MRAAIYLLAIAACGDPELPQQLPDAPFDPFCLIAGDYGDVGTKTGTTSLGPTTSTIVLDPGPPRDSFFIRLTNGNGVFSGGFQNGTFTLSGAELGTQTCGVCVNLLADIGNMGPAKFYFATGGTVTLTSTSPPAGSIADVTMQEVTSGGAPIAGGCVGSIDAMAFSTN